MPTEKHPSFLLEEAADKKKTLNILKSSQCPEEPRTSGPVQVIKTLLETAEVVAKISGSVEEAYTHQASKFSRT